MEKQFVSYELTLQLKELGFDEQCLGEYRKDNEESWYDPRKGEDVTIGSNDIFFTTSYYNNFKERSSHLCKAPLWQQAFNWFMTENNIIVVIDRSFGYSYSIHKDTHQFEIIEKEGTFGSYEDARLACLKKLIEINDKS